MGKTYKDLRRRVRRMIIHRNESIYEHQKPGSMNVLTGYIIDSSESPDRNSYEYERPHGADGVNKAKRNRSIRHAVKSALHTWRFDRILKGKSQ